MEVNRTEKITFRCTALEKAALAEQAARLKGTLQRLNNYFGGRQYREVFEENQALINELKKILSR